jgi:hypothetical protein
MSETTDYCPLVLRSRLEIPEGEPNLPEPSLSREICMTDERHFIEKIVADGRLNKNLPPDPDLEKIRQEEFLAKILPMDGLDDVQLLKTTAVHPSFRLPAAVTTDTLEKRFEDPQAVNKIVTRFPSGGAVIAEVDENNVVLRTYKED